MFGIELLFSLIVFLFLLPKKVMCHTSMVLWTGDAQQTPGGIAKGDNATTVAHSL